MLRWTRSLLLLMPLVMLLGTWAFPRSGQTLPLFARKYHMECTQCHSAFPRLNKFGMEFRQRGYRLEGADGTSPWEDESFPLSLIGDVGVQYTRTDTADVITGARGSTSASAFRQTAVEFHTAGTLARKVTFHFDNGFANDTGVLESGMAFVQLDDVAKGGALNVKAGIYDAEIPYLASSRRTTQADYMMPVTLDAGGIELNGTQKGWWYAAGLINSGRSAGKPTDTSLNNLENVYAWLMRDIGPNEVTARVYYDQQDPRAAGKSSSARTQVDASAWLNTPHVIVIPAYTYQKFADQTAQNLIHSGLLEAMWLMNPEHTWVTTARYEIEHLPKTSASIEEDHSLVALNLSYMVNRNARLAFEWAHTADNVQGPRVDDVEVYVHVGY